MNAWFIDYAGKNWAGLVQGYYLPRWKKFTALVMESVEKGVQEFDTNTYAHAEMIWGNDFTLDTSVTYPTEETGNTAAISTLMQHRYGNAYVSVNSYTSHKDSDIDAAYNLCKVSAWTDNLPQLQFLCDADPACKGFSSAGMFKTNVDNLVDRDGSVLYIKHSAGK
jgi:hypothetical protein